MSIDITDTPASVTEQNKHKQSETVNIKEKKHKRRKKGDDVAGVKEKKKKHAKKSGETEHVIDLPTIPDENRGKKRKREEAVKVTNGDLEKSDEGKGKKSKKERKEEKKERKEKKSKEARERDKKSTEETNTSEPAVVLPSQSGSAPSTLDAKISEYLLKHGITIDCGSNSVLPKDLEPILSFESLLPRIPTPLHSTFGSFKEPTPIQACSWPASLNGRDVVGIAETGSGKTLAFGVPAVLHVVSDRSVTKTKKAKSKGDKSQISVLAVAPTRELAIQIHDTFTGIGKPFGLTSIAVYGGVDKAPQRSALKEKSAAMIVGTPGRILDLVNEGSCNLSGVTYLVLDEADRMLDKGFENDIRAIIGHCGPSGQRQTLMFSATWPDSVRRLASTFLRKPVRVTVGSDDLTANRRVEQVVEVFEDTREKDSRLLAHLRTLTSKKSKQPSPTDETRILIFVLYKKEASRVEQSLRWKGYTVGGIHGDLSQVARMNALEDFKTGKTQLLVATDVAARGLDIPNVGTVINYSFPLTVEDYVHRIGRTGRGGKSGKSITFFTGDNHERALAGELAKVMREGGFDASPLKKFPMTIKKKEHSVYGAFYRDDIPSDAKPTRMKFS